MRIVEFQEVGMENFGPYIDPMTLTFTNNSLTLLTGPNGIGKTMSLDAIPFTLYGITTKKAKGDDVVNNSVKKNCKTYVKFKVNDDQYIVTRYHKYTKLGNTVIVNKNGVDIKKGQKEVLPEMERVLCPQKAFMNTLMFGQKVKDFFTDLVDSDKKEIFRKILNLGRYTEYYKEADIKLKSTKSTFDIIANDLSVDQGLLQNTLQQIEVLEESKKQFNKNIKDDIADLKKSLQENERLLKQWQEQLSQLKIEDIKETEKELNNVSAKLKSLDTKYSLMFSELEKQQNIKLSEISDQARKAKDKITEETKTSTSKLTDIKEGINIELNSIDRDLQDKTHLIEIDIESNHQSIIALEARIFEIKKNVLDAEISICPTCEQDVTKETENILVQKIEGYLKKIEDHKSNMHKFGTLKSKIETEFEKKRKTCVDKVGEVLKEQEKINNDETQQLKVLNKRLDVAVKQVEKLCSDQQKDYNQRAAIEKKDLTIKKMELDSVKQIVEQQQKKADEINTTVLKINEQINSINIRIKYKESEEYDETHLNSYIKKVSELNFIIQQHTEKLKINNDNIEVLQFWKTGYSSTGIPSMLIDESIPLMNKQVSYYLDLLTNGRYIVSFDTLDETKAGEFRDKISVRVVDTYTKANSRVQLSGGQTRIVDIATILTLGDLQSNINDVKFNILLFDEIFDALDEENVGYVSKVLNQLKIKRSIYIISHQHQDQLEPDETLAFT